MTAEGETRPDFECIPQNGSVSGKELGVSFNFTLRLSPQGEGQGPSAIPGCVIERVIREARTRQPGTTIAVYDWLCLQCPNPCKVTGTATKLPQKR